MSAIILLFLALQSNVFAAFTEDKFIQVDEPFEYCIPQLHSSIDLENNCLTASFFEDFQCEMFTNHLRDLKRYENEFSVIRNSNKSYTIYR